MRYSFTRDRALPSVEIFILKIFFALTDKKTKSGGSPPPLPVQRKNVGQAECPNRSLRHEKPDTSDNPAAVKAVPFLHAWFIRVALNSTGRVGGTIGNEEEGTMTKVPPVCALRPDGDEVRK